MQITLIDFLVFFGFIAAVVSLSLWASRKESDSADYFLAGRSLTWPLIGLSLLASNISTEQFIGMSGAAFGRVGLAIASYELMSAVVLVLVAWWLLPKFLKAGIYTMPEFLEYRYNSTSRSILAFFMMLAYVLVALATVLYSGAIALNGMFDFDSILTSNFGFSQDQANFWALMFAIIFIALIGGTYTLYGGLKAVVWADLIQGSALILGGGLVTVLGFKYIGGDSGFLHGVKIFAQENESKLNLILPWNDPDVPWVAVFIGGLWIPAIFYWGLNQFITQRTLGAKNLAEGQKGIMFAAFLKLLTPAIVVVPGIIAFHLYKDQISNPDEAYPYLVQNMLPPYLRGILLAALFGAVISSFNAMLNSAATIFTMDFYTRYINPQAAGHKIIRVGRIATGTFLLMAIIWSPMIYFLGEGVFVYIQKFWGFITPGIVSAFIIGMLIKRTPAFSANIAMIMNIPVYGLLLYFLPNVAFLHHMAITFLILSAFMIVATLFKPLKEPVHMPENKDINLDRQPSLYIVGTIVLVLVALLFIVFR